MSDDTDSGTGLPDRDGLGRIVVGAIGGAFGVKGEVRLKSFCADPEAIVDYLPLVTPDGRVFDDITITGQTSGALTALLGGIGTKEAADTLRGVTLLAERSRLPALPEDEYYHADLIGLTVRDSGGAPLGRVKSVMNHGAGDLLEIERPGSAVTVLLPFTREIVPTVELATGRIVADPPDGTF